MERYNKDSLLIYEIDSKYQIKSLLSTKLSVEKYADKTLIIVQKIGDEMAISARRNDGKKNMNKLLKSAVGTLAGNAGGHAPASGGSVSIKDYPQFKKQLIEHEKDKEIEIKD